MCRLPLHTLTWTVIGLGACAFDAGGLPGAPGAPDGGPAADAARADAPTVPSAPGYEQVSGTDVRYRPVLAPATLEAAAADCDDDVAGAHLVVVDDAAENGVVRRFADARVAGDRIWLGITDAAIEGVWRTVDGAAVDYVHWKDGEPNDGGDDGDGEDCAVMLGVHDPGPDRGRWNDVACDEPHPYVCEWHPPASP